MIRLSTYHLYAGTVSYFFDGDTDTVVFRIVSYHRIVSYPSYGPNRAGGLGEPPNMTARCAVSGPQVEPGRSQDPR